MKAVLVYAMTGASWPRLAPYRAPGFLEALSSGLDLSIVDVFETSSTRPDLSGESGRLPVWRQPPALPQGAEYDTIELSGSPWHVLRPNHTLRALCRAHSPDLIQTFGFASGLSQV